MNGFKFSDFVKRILVIFLLVSIMSGPRIVFARAGGGTSGGHTSSSNHNSSINRSSTNKSSSSDDLGIVGKTIMAIIFGIPTVVFVIFKIKLNNKSVKCISDINELSKSDYNWNYENIKKNIEEAFYKVQSAWMERDQDIAKEYMSDKLYSKHKLETENMKLRREKNILENLTLLGVIPRSVQNNEGTDMDCIWFEIRAKAKDYTINEDTNKVIQGKYRRCNQFTEYWKFTRKDNRWVLDEIKQKF